MTPTWYPKSSDAAARPPVIAAGEVLWDIFADARRLGGAPLNFAAHLGSLGHAVSVVSGLGADALGREAAAIVARLGVDVRWLKTTVPYATGTAEVSVGPNGEPAFAIRRPAAYDSIELAPDELEALARTGPGWLYFGTLLPSSPGGQRTLESLFEALPDVPRFYDINLRPGADDPGLMLELLACADVVKLNEDEQRRVSELADLPRGMESFCRAARDRFELRSLSVTLGARGCALLHADEYVEAPGHAITVADTVGAGDAFAAAFLHGLTRGWSAADIADFANSTAAAVASVRGALPDPAATGEVFP